MYVQRLNACTSSHSHMDAWRWYLALMQQPDDSAEYIGGKRNNGGDSYLGVGPIACVIALQVLACGDGRLRMTVAKPANK